MVSMFGSEPKDKGSNPLTPVMISNDDVGKLVKPAVCNTVIYGFESHRRLLVIQFYAVVAQLAGHQPRKLAYPQGFLGSSPSHGVIKMK